MNRTAIEWTDFSWNPVTGCRRGCKYCYARGAARRFGKTFEPELHPDRLDQPQRRKAPAKIFVCSMADLFGPWVPNDWIFSVIDAASRARRHTFQFLTKYPERLADFAFPKNAWVGVSATNFADSDRAAIAMRRIKATVKFMSAEPMLGHVGIFHSWRPDWLIIGRQTGPGPQPAPPEGAVEHLTLSADTFGVPVFHKPSLGDGFDRRDFPEVLP
jgi:protein gp37